MKEEGERLKDFWKRWGHTPDDNEEFLKFRARVIEVARDAWDNYMPHSPYLLKEFAFQSGTHYDPRERGPGYPYSELSEILNSTSTHFDVIQAMQFLLETFSAQDKAGAVAEITRALKRVFDVTPNIRLEVSLHDGHAIIYPGGAGLLDEAVIESNLAFLQTYPKVLKPFETALKIYLSKDVTQQRNMLDELRVALEEMAKEVLKNGKTLENNTPELAKWLKEHDAHAHIRNMFPTLLSYFTNYQNDAVKHQEDKYTPAEIEFILYLVGTFLRFIQRVGDSSSGARSGGC